ncbi:MAG TPA: ATP-binding protein [Armatimonadota bacterium]|nr:ATP-binding protein [Armatimonadota bacterium]
MSGAQAHQSRFHVAFSFPADPNSIGEVRHLVISEARLLPFSPDDIDDIALAVSEAFTNLVQYAPGYRIRGECDVRPNELEIRFDVEPGIRPYINQRIFPAGLARSGRGIPLLNLLIPIVEVKERPDGTWELRLIKPVTDVKE